MMQFKVMTYNIHHGKGTNGKQSLGRIAELVKESGADIVGFNEVDRIFSRRSSYVDQFSWLSAKLDMYAVFGAAMTRKRGEASPGAYGNAIFSRFPIMSSENHILKHRRFTISEPRLLLEAEVDIANTGDGTAKIFATHLSVHPVIQRKQTELIIKKVSDQTLPVILLGNMNTKPGSGSWKRLSSVLNDVGKSAPSINLRTFPSFRPQIQLDYIFVSDSIQIIDAKVIDTERSASDHLPLQATLSLNI